MTFKIPLIDNIIEEYIGLSSHYHSLDVFLQFFLHCVYFLEKMEKNNLHLAYFSVRIDETKHC